MQRKEASNGDSRGQRIRVRPRDLLRTLRLLHQGAEHYEHNHPGARPQSVELAPGLFWNYRRPLDLSRLAYVRPLIGGGWWETTYKIHDNSSRQAVVAIVRKVATTNAARHLTLRRIQAFTAWLRDPSADLRAALENACDAAISELSDSQRAVLALDALGSAH